MLPIKLTQRFLFFIVPLDIQYEWYHSPYKGQTDMGVIFNSLWAGDAKWQHRTGPTLAQVILCCLTVLGHYLNHFDLSLVKFRDNLLRAISQEIHKPSVAKYIASNLLTKDLFKSPGANELRKQYKYGIWEQGATQCNLQSWKNSICAFPVIF